MELIAAHVIFRHGERTPVATFPTDPMREKDWPVGYGQLTTTGMEQQHRLGKYLRDRYGSILNTTYIANEIYVRSTDYDRALMSAESNLVGLYPLDNISDDKIPIQPVPIHTVPQDQEFLLSMNTCPRYDQIQTQMSQTDQFKNLSIYYNIQIWTNLSHVNMLNTVYVADTVFIERIYNKTPTWVDEAVLKNLSDIRDLFFYLSYSDNDSKRIRGGPLIQDIWINMNDASQGRTYRKFASAIFLDLLKQNSTYYVKVEYLNVTDSNQPYSYLLEGCPALECPLNTFTTIYQPRFPANATVECTIKVPSNSSSKLI
ncbi:unnamed protein product [Rotaria sp. Silwood2]|nr:unnamed protein product [Rotaria sp. Silwood2]CAF4328842.1 unnamed protein product [Rotaria sp. Silwood2]CAF4372542.1 unnamed protein product [Rotaria sp. Silwood2]CAF4409113.1 unnamed protein product [Rotaria sp. Silwood2]CAF4412130.1 unnamed protein product [Rotaria sp. Silwood2]